MITNMFSGRSATLGLLVCSLLFSQCKKKEKDPPVVSDPEPVAAFTFDKSQYRAGDSVIITNTSTDADTYAWTLKDPDGLVISNTPNGLVADGMPGSQFPLRLSLLSKNGTYTLKLLASGHGKSGTVTQSFAVSTVKSKLRINTTAPTKGSYQYRINNEQVTSASMGPPNTQYVIEVDLPVGTWTLEKVYYSNVQTKSITLAEGQDTDINF